MLLSNAGPIAGRRRAVGEYLQALEETNPVSSDAPESAESLTPPKMISLTDPTASWTAASGGRAFLPVIASTDYIRALTDQLQAFIPQRFVVLGTDGFGRSDTREKLRHFFEVDRYWVAVAALKALADEGTIERKVVAQALKKYKLDPSKPNPMTV